MLSNLKNIFFLYKMRRVPLLAKRSREGITTQKMLCVEKDEGAAVGIVKAAAAGRGRVIWTFLISASL